MADMNTLLPVIVGGVIGIAGGLVGPPIVHWLQETEKTASREVRRASLKRGDELCEGAGRLAVEESNHRHRWLLRARRERPRRCRAAEQRDELASP